MVYFSLGKSSEVSSFFFFFLISLKITYKGQPSNNGGRKKNKIKHPQPLIIMSSISWPIINKRQGSSGFYRYRHWEKATYYKHPVDKPSPLIFPIAIKIKCNSYNWRQQPWSKSHADKRCQITWSVIKNKRPFGNKTPQRIAEPFVFIARSGKESVDRVSVQSAQLRNTSDVDQKNIGK